MHTVYLLRSSEDEPAEDRVPAPGLQHPAGERGGREPHADICHGAELCRGFAHHPAFYAPLLPGELAGLALPNPVHL